MELPRNCKLHVGTMIEDPYVVSLLSQIEQWKLFGIKSVFWDGARCVAQSWAKALQDEGHDVTIFSDLTGTNISSIQAAEFPKDLEFILQG